MNRREVRDSLPSTSPLVKSYYKGESDTPVSTLTIGEVLVEAAANKPDLVIYRIPENNDSITVKTLLNKSKLFSRALLSRSIGKGDVVMVLGVYTCDFYVMFHGTVGIGARFFCPFLFDPKEKAVVELMDEARPKLIILGCEMDFLFETIQDYNFRVSEKTEVILYPREENDIRTGFSSYKDLLKSSSTVSCKEFGHAQSLFPCDETALLQCTSGTTGKFKLCLLSHRCLVNTGIFGQARRDPKNEKKIVGFCNSKLGDLSPLLDSLSILCNWMFELQGVNYPTTILEDPSTLLQFLQDESIEYLKAFPYMLSRIINNPITDNYDLSRWQGGFLVGQVTDRQTRQWFQERMSHYMVGYGGSEFLSGTATSPLHTNKEKLMTTIGYPFPHIEVKLIDEQDEVVDIGRVGEICLRGWAVFNGYQQNRLIVAGTDDHGWIRMGDMAKMDSTGHLTFFGRKADSVRFKKEADCVYPYEIENVALQHRNVKQAAVVGVPAKALGDHICLCVVPKENSNLQVEDLKTFCTNKLYSRDRPTFYFIFDSFPTVGIRQKISKDKIRKEARQRIQDVQPSVL